ncbi:MAG: LptF/LptG family permease [Ignavibacteriae bacterium]|nr:LptF/LptG family permease [Ignavibacteriota bacterium]
MIIYKYILKAHIGPFFFSLLTLMFLFLFQFLIKSIDELVGKGLSLWIIIQLISLNLAWMVTLAVPMAVLVSTLMAFGNLASANEITIMKASGLSLQKLMFPMLIFAVIITYLMVLFNNDVLPEANHSARMLLQDISRTKPTFILEPGKFSDDIGGAKILVRKTFENSNNIEGISIYDYSSPEYRNLITAEKGDIGFTSDFSKVVMNLSNGEIHQLDVTSYVNGYRRIKFENHRITLDAAGFGFHRSSDNAFIRGDRELSAQAMNSLIDTIIVTQKKNRESVIESVRRDALNFNNINFRDTILSQIPFGKDSLKRSKLYDSLSNIRQNIMNKTVLLKSQLQIETQTEKQIATYNVEIYKKYSIPFACMIFALIGAPLGYRVRRGGFGIASGISLLFFLIYWASLIGGEKLADREFVSPFLGMWLVNIVLGIFGLYLMFKSS